MHLIFVRDLHPLDAMAMLVSADVGKYVLLDRDSTIRTEKIYQGEYAMVMEHRVIP